MTHSSILLPSSTSRTIDTSVQSEEEIAFREFLNEHLAGQEEAKDAVVSILNAIRNPLRDPNKPIDSSLFIGPSTAGKTRAFKLLVRWVHGAEDKMAFFSGSDFEEKHQIQKLIGAPHGYLGYVDTSDPKYRAPQPGEPDDSAMLSQHNLDNTKLGCKEDIVFILFDEWEKFHFAFNRFMLRPLREGSASLNNGRPVNFRNAVICFTSNLAADELERMKTPMGFRSSDTKVITSGAVRQTVTRELLRGYPPEFRNRIDRIVCFTELGDDELIKVVDIELETFSKRIYSLGAEKIFILQVDKSAKAFLLKRDAKSATRAGDEKSAIPAMQQAMKDLLEQPLGRMARLGVIHGGDRVEVSYKDGDESLTFNVFADPISEALKAVAPKEEVPQAVRIDAGSVESTASTDGKTTAASSPAASTPDHSKSAPSSQASQPEGAGQYLMVQSVIIQEFQIVLRAADNQHAQLKEALFNGLASSPFIRVAEEATKYGEMTVHAGVVVAVNVTTVKVEAPIELMFSLKRSMPFLDVSTIATPLEL
ncbi:MAG: AAA family ATPase [Cyanobacteria bacterium REEB67]|nr:AAA family ATPase [Cyanobacteria bacterium REEB67]